MIVVADASPIIALSRVERPQLLHDVFAEILVPEEVRDELAAGAGGEEILRSHVWIESRPVRDRELVNRLAAGLDVGEAAAIALAIETQAELLLMDERRGRAIADQQGLSVVGVVGVLLRAKTLGLVVAIGPILDDLVSRGRFHLAREVVARARTLANE